MRHRFKKGASVILDSSRQVNAAGTYTIVQLLPVEGGAIRYRIKSKFEVFERVASEFELIQK
jgi:hypothetical protein